VSLEPLRRRSRWWIVFGSTVGLIFSTGPLVQFTFGVFILPVSAALHVDRGSVSAALLAALGLSGVLTPVAGLCVDRWGIRRVGAPVIALFAGAFALIGVASTSLGMFIGCYALAGIFSAGQTPLIYAKAITAAFDDRRGLALGTAMAGVGVGTALMPRLAQDLIAAFGWRQAYVALGAATLLVTLPAVILFVHDGAGARDATACGAGTSGLTGAQALKSPRFWALAGAFFLVAVASAGVMAHIVPMMADRGVPAPTAALALSAGGIALIAGRLLAGYALDHVFAPYVASFFFAMPLVAIVILLMQPGIALSFAATVLVGMGLGAEVDLIAYLQSRYFGLRRFGEIYGYLLAVFMVGSGVGPFAMGLAFTHAGGYSWALAAFAGGLTMACASMLTYPAYAFGAEAPEAPEAAVACYEARAN
jgi:predicted MFS family arabinose efflux permease